MAKKLVLVGGLDAEKNFVSISLIHYLRTEFPNENILLIETDKANPDVGKMYKGTNSVMLSTPILDEKEDCWANLMDEIEQAQTEFIIINTLGVIAQGELLDKAIRDNALGDIDFIALWVMNRSLDSVNLLRDFLKVMTTPRIYPVLNTYFGEPSEFTNYTSDCYIHAQITDRGGELLEFPRLEEKIAGRFIFEAKKPSDLLEAETIGWRIILSNWLQKTKLYTFNPIFHGSATLEEK